MMEIEKDEKAPSLALEDGDSFLLAGKLLCGHCMGTMVGDSGTDTTGGRFSSYSCRKRKLTHFCDKKSVNKDWLEQEVTRLTASAILRDDVIEYLTDRVMEMQEKGRPDASTIAHWNSRLSKTNAAIRKIMKAIEDGVGAENADERLRELKAARADLQSEIERAEIAPPGISRGQVEQFLRGFQGGDTGDKEYQRQMISLFVERVLLYDDKIMIAYNHKEENNEVLTVIADETAYAAADERSNSPAPEDFPSPENPFPTRQADSRPNASLPNPNLVLSPPLVPLLLCDQTGKICFQNHGADRELLPLSRRKNSAIFSLLSEQGRKIFTFTAKNGGCRFLNLDFPTHRGLASSAGMFSPASLGRYTSSAPSNSDSDPAGSGRKYLLVPANRRNRLILLGLPFFIPPNAEAPNPTRLQSACFGPLRALVTAAAAYAAAQVSVKENRRDTPSSLPWLNARLFALNFEENKRSEMRSVGRTVSFLSRLCRSSSLFPSGDAPLLTPSMSDPFALFLEHANVALLMMLALCRFCADVSGEDSGDASGDEGKRPDFLFFFQNQMLRVAVCFAPAPSFFREGRKKLPWDTAGTVSDLLAPLEELYFPDKSFAKFSTLSPKYALLLLSVKNLCTRCGWEMQGEVFRDETGQSMLRLCWDFPVLHRSGVSRLFLSTDEDVEHDFMRFLDFLCPRNP